MKLEESEESSRKKDIDIKSMLEKQKGLDDQIEEAYEKLQAITLRKTELEKEQLEKVSKITAFKSIANDFDVKLGLDQFI